MSKLNIVVVANCQARPIAKLLQVLSSKIQVTSEIIVHLSKTEDFGKYKQKLEKSDWIISQLVADTYPCEFVRTTFLKERYGKKVITILNLYFSGYTPDWFYIRIPKIGILKGPLGDYHNKTIFRSFLQDSIVKKAIEQVKDINWNKNEYGGVSAVSLAELCSREKVVDVAISDYIDENMFKKRLFYTFNHPAMDLLLVYVKRILQKLEIEVNDTTELNLQEPLNQLIPMLNCAIEFEFPQEKYYKGMEVVKINGLDIELGGTKYYTLENITNKFYEVYQENSFNLKGFSFK